MTDLVDCWRANCTLHLPSDSVSDNGPARCERPNSLVVSALLLISLGCVRINSPVEYLLPANYVGWISIRCGVSGVAPLQTVDGKLQIVVPDGGRVRTSSDCKAGLRSVQYWYVDALKRRVSELFLDQPGEVSHVTVIGPKLGDSELSGVVFWVGPEPLPEEINASYQSIIDSEFR